MQDVQVTDDVVGEGREVEKGALITTQYRGWLEDGSRNGKIAKPTVRMMPAIEAPEAMKARPPRRARSSTALASAPSRPSTGNTSVAGMEL